MLTVSIGNTPLSVFLAIANFPGFPSAATAFQPPNSSISRTCPLATFLAFPSSSIFWIFSLFWIVSGNDSNLFERVFTSAPSAGLSNTWDADVSSVVLGVVSVRNGLFVSNIFPLRSSLEPEFAIELDSEDFSVFVAFLPTVAFPFVVSTAGASFFSSGFVCNFVVAVTNLACACDNSACVFALFNTDFASSKAVFNWFTLLSVLLAYVPWESLPSISLIKSVNSFLSRVSTFWGADSGEELFSTVEGWVFVSTVAAGLIATVFPS